MFGGSLTVVWIGDVSHLEMEVPNAWLARHAVLQIARKPTDAERLVSESTSASLHSTTGEHATISEHSEGEEFRSVDWIVWAAPTRPLPDGDAIQRILRLSPLTKIVIVTGSWLLAAGRTAQVPAGVMVCRWDRWEMWAARHLLVEQPDAANSLLVTSASASASSSAATAEQVDRFYEPGRFDPPRIGAMGVLVLTERRQEFETIANALTPMGAVAFWSRPDESLVCDGAQLLIVDVEPDHVEKAMNWREKFAPRLACLICSGWEPSVDLDASWIRKPFRLDEFWKTVQKIVNR